MGSFRVAQQGSRKGNHESFEYVARERGCEKDHLETFSFEEKPFYESLDYKVFAKLDNYPKGHKKYFMSKDL